MRTPKSGQSLSSTVIERRPTSGIYPIKNDAPGHPHTNAASPKKDGSVIGSNI